MLIRVGGGSSGIKEYLERGHKQGREHSRDELDERVILAGDLEFTDQIINDLDINSERYLHITLAFKEDEISHETLAAIAKDFREFAFSAYGDNEVNFYAEAHLPKIKSYVSQKTGELVERKPHMHIIIPKVNMLSGGHLNPLGMVEHNERFIDSFQEHINNKCGLASPKDYRRLTFTNASDMIQRYKDDHFDGNNKDLKKEILGAVLDRNITDYEGFKDLIKEFGETRTRNAGTDSEYQNVKPTGQAKGVNLKDFVFSKEFIALPDTEKHSALTRELDHKYEVQGQARRDPANVAAGLADWHGYRAMEIKYLNSGNKKLYKAYKESGPEEKQRILSQQARKFYEKYQEVKNEPEQFRRNPFDHQYGFKRPEHELGRRPDDPGGARRDGRADGRADGLADGRAPGAAGGDRGRFGSTGAGDVRGTDPDGLTARRIAFAASGKYDPFPASRGQATKTINGVRTMSGIDVAGDPGRPKVLLQDHARVQLDHARAGGADALRRDSHRQRELNSTGRVTDSLLSQYSRDFEHRRQVGAAGELAEFKEIRSHLDATRLLADLSVSHGVLIDKYSVSSSTDGSDRIRVGNRNLNVSDFLTKEMRLPWQEAAAILRESYARQAEQHPVSDPRRAPLQALWREFQDERNARGGQRQLLGAQLSSEQTRRAVLRETMARERQHAESLPPAQRKAANSLARMGFVTGESALKDAIKVERAQFRAPTSEQYRGFLRERAQGGSNDALAELRRMAKANKMVPGDLGSIGSVRTQDEPNSMIYRGKEMRYIVHNNGDVVYTLSGRAIIQDKGDKLVLLQNDRAAIEAALRLGEAKYGNVLMLTGPKDFQERAAVIAAEAGMSISFTDKRVEAVRQHRASELASERATRQTHRELGGRFVDEQRGGAATTRESVKKIDTPEPERSRSDKGPER
jgi:predicted transcriptional regulator